MTTDPTPTTTPEDPSVAVLARLTTLGQERTELLADLEEVEAEMRDLVRTSVAVEAKHDPDRPVSQLAAAKAVGVDRMTVRDWLGVRRRTGSAPRSAR